MNKSKNRLIIAVGVISSLLVLTGCGNPAMMSMMSAGLPVEAVKLNETPVEESGIYQATLISRNSVSLQPQVTGQIANIYVKAGDHVKTGQLLMLIDKSKQEAILNSIRSNAAALRASVTQAKDMLYTYQVQRKALKSSLDLSKKLYDRYSSLYEKHSVSKQDLEKYTDSYTQAQSNLDANEAQIQVQKSAIKTAISNYNKAVYSIREQEVKLQHYKISAPYSGIVGDIPVKVGNYVEAKTQLISITQNNTLEVNVGLPVEKVFQIHNGLPIQVLDDKGNIVESSKISFVSPKVDTETQTILVKAIINNSSNLLKADQSVKVRVIYNKAPGILVPTSAISHFGGQDFAFNIIEKDNKTFVKQLPVKLGNIQDNKYIVINGLKAGDRVVSQGIQKLMDGAPVTVLPERK